MDFNQKNEEILKKMKKGSQLHRVYLYLRDNGTITVQQSMKMWGYYYPAVSINRLRKHGAKIVDINIGADGKRKEIFSEWKLIKD